MKKTMNIFALSAVVLAVSAALASCQKENATPETPEVRVIHVDLDATVADTKATYAEKEVTIQDDDQLYITLTGAEDAWTATGTLTYATSKFSGDITVSTGSYAGSDPITDAKGLTATFLPKDYSTVGYLSATGEATATKAFYAGDKAASVPQLVHLTASVSDKAGEAKTPLTLSAQNSVLCYSINANKLTAGAHTVSVSDGTTTISGSVTAVADAATTFAVAFPANATAKNYTLSISGYNNVAKTGKTLVAGKVVNITTDVTVDANAPLSGVFSVGAATKVKFSKGNLQLTAANTWKFADNQWDYFGTFQSDNHRDLFGWGAANPNNTSTTDSQYTWSEWGENTNLVSALGSGWRTLTSAEWTYLFNTRTVNGGTGSGKSYTLGQSVSGKLGVVLYPDNYTGSVYAGSDWSTFEAAGCVFLPAAGYRSGSSVYGVGSFGLYWSSTPNGTNYACYLDFYSSSVFPASFNDRCYGYSVRLVQDQQ